LTLDDVAWRPRRIRIQQRKTGRLFWLPLTDEVATALLNTGIEAGHISE